jgi:hypothetical protein
MKDQMFDDRTSTNFLRVLAIALVVNSHMDSLYPAKFAFLASGGMMGNALFFALSSWGLLLSMQKQQRAFGEWYLRRIVRIYPPVWVTVILLTFPLGMYAGRIRLDNVLDEMSKFFFPPFWFLEALMIYYALIFCIVRRFSYRRLVIASLPVVVSYALYYVFLLDLSRFSIEGTPFRLIFYFLVVLWGLYLGSQNDKLQFKGLPDVCLVALSVGCIYGHKYLMRRGLLLSYQFIEHLATFPLLYYFAKVAKSSFIRQTIMGSRYIGKALTFISGMTLEIFMVNNSLDLLDTKLGTFPLNVIILLAINFVLALLIFYSARPIIRALETGHREKRPVEQVGTWQCSPS